MPTICTVHIGRWGGDPLCKHCRTPWGTVRHRERDRTRLRWHTSGVVYLTLVGVAIGFMLGLGFANIDGYPFH